MDIELEAYSRASATGRDLHRPEFFRLAHPADRARLHELLKSTPAIRVHDELHSQLCELVRALHPSVKFTRDELSKAAGKHLGDTSSEDYGTWVYYPWSQRLVHLLDEAEFALVRTDRNRNKITREEQERLGNLKIGVVGLSVGQSICLTLALERSFGELRIADFDTLDLSNLNRIRSGVHSLGHLKTVNVAREIAEIDPFLKVTLFNEGLTRENIGRFLCDGGRLDMLVDECDSVDVKILCRQQAKALGIPVIMDTSDRGMLDVERFDLEPDRPILHGLIDHLDPNDAAKAKTNEEKLPFVLPILGIDTLSKRMKASMLEIESSVTTWPQLASSVVLGGAVGADVVRRIALGQFNESGRWFVDLETVVGNADAGAPSSSGKPASIRVPVPLQPQDMVALVDGLDASPLPHILDQRSARILVEAACLAPSGGNSQPWRFLWNEGRLYLFMDPARAFSTIDPGHIYARLGLGACIENILLKARDLGLALQADLSPSETDGPLIAVFTRRSEPTAPVVPDKLSESIALRCTNRKPGKGAPLGLEEIKGLRESLVAEVPTATVQFTTDHGTIAQIAGLCGAAERVRILNPVSHWDMFKREMRWTQEEAERTRDGVDVRSLELSLVDNTGVHVAADGEAIALLHGWNAGRGFEKLSRKVISASAAIALIRIPDLSTRNTIEGGRAVQRLWLKATELKLAVQPISAPLFMGLHHQFDRNGIYSASERAELANILDLITHCFDHANSQPFFLLRLDRAEEPSVRSLRRPLEDVLFVHQPVAA